MQRTNRSVTNKTKTRAANGPCVQREKKLAACLRGEFGRMLLIFCLALAHACNPTVAPAQGSADEYELKAAMLYNLTRFVDWPAAAYADAQAPTVLCILGRDPFGDSLASLASNPSSSPRRVEIRHITNDKGVRACHVVYISTSERKNAAQILTVLKGTSVLTVGEMTQFAARGGMVQFSLKEKQVHFEINLDAASEANLKISSRLLLLARIVKEQSKNPSREGSALPFRRQFDIASARTRGSESGLDSLEAAISSGVGVEPRGHP